MASIFISHSKRDEATINAFCRVFAQTNMRAVLEEFENYVIPPWPKIRKDVLESSAVFVLLSPHLSGTPFTQNWVSFEVGLACAANKPVWVYEQLQNPASFPIPYLTDYVIYNPQSDEDLRAITGLVESFNPSPAFAGLILGAIVGGLISGGLGAGAGALAGAKAFERKNPGLSVNCCYPNCGIQFRIYSQFQQFWCPVCRQPLRFNPPAA